MKPFSSEQALRMWLAEKGIDTSQWGKGAAKSVANLWQEIMNGDTRLQDKPPLRLVQVTEVVIRDGDKVLVEAEQEFGNGSRRQRNRLPSEKMRLDENVREAALRCLKEELGIDSESVTFLDAPPAKYKLMKESPSYPGLPTQYTFYRLETAVTGLPTGDFWRDNAAFAHGDPIRRHKWRWRSDWLGD